MTQILLKIKVSVHLIEKWHHFVSTKTLLHVRGRVSVWVRVRLKHWWANCFGKV